ncbi:transcriptional repressor [Candidatus Gracilibacteria bacterium]|nr:transcriptional repressor [Candidatus Gracilibacteria bacterium]
MNKNRYKNEIYLICKSGPQNADQIFKKLKKNYPYIGIGTVYRNLTELWEEGKLEKISGITSKTIYDVKKSDNLHGHLVCERSGRIINVDVSKIKNLDLGLPEGFNLEKVEVVFYGNFDESDGNCKGRIALSN